MVEAILFLMVGNQFSKVNSKTASFLIMEPEKEPVLNCHSGGNQFVLDGRELVSKVTSETASFDNEIGKKNLY